MHRRYSGRGGLFEGPTLTEGGIGVPMSPMVPKQVWGGYGQHPGAAKLSRVPGWPAVQRVGFAPQAMVTGYQGFGAPPAQPGLRDWLRRTFFIAPNCPAMVAPTAQPEKTPMAILPPGQGAVQPPGQHPLDAEAILMNRSQPVWTGPLQNGPNGPGAQYTPRGGILDGSVMQGGLQDGQPMEAAYYDATRPRTIGTGVEVTTLPNTINNNSSVPGVNITPGFPMAGFGAAMQGGVGRPEVTPRQIGYTGASEPARRPHWLGKSTFGGRVYANGGGGGGVPEVNITPGFPMAGFDAAPSHSGGKRGGREGMLATMTGGPPCPPGMGYWRWPVDGPFRCYSENPYYKGGGAAPNYPKPYGMGSYYQFRPGQQYAGFGAAPQPGPLSRFLAWATGSGQYGMANIQPGMAKIRGGASGYGRSPDGLGALWGFG